METGKLTPLEALEIEEIERIAAERQEADQEGGQEEVSQRFAITNLSSLNWAFRKIAVLGKRVKEVEDLAKEEKARIDAWKDKQLKVLSSDMGFFEMLVADWAEKARAADSKFKKETTPFGEVSFKKQQPEWTYPDEPSVVEWCKTHDMEALVKSVTTESVADKTQFKKAFDIKLNVIVQVGDVLNEAGEIIIRDGEVLDTIGEDDHGHLYALHYFTDEEGNGMNIIDKDAGEVVKNVRFMESAVVERISELVVPGVNAAPRPDKLEIKASK